MPEMSRFKWKVCLVGEAGVGKTSLIRRFVLDSFDDRYMITLGTKVTKKELEMQVPPADRMARVDLAIWDIMGQSAFLDLLQDAFFTGAHGILAVADLTRRPTLEGLDTWVRSVQGIAGNVPVLIVVNKADLSGRAAFEPRVIEGFAGRYGSEYVMASAKTGAGVEEAFTRLAAKIARQQIERSPAR